MVGGYRSSQYYFFTYNFELDMKESHDKSIGEWLGLIGVLKGDFEIWIPVDEVQTKRYKSKSGQYWSVLVIIGQY